MGSLRYRGGIEEFLVVNFFMVVTVLYGFKKLIEGVRIGFVFSCAVTLSGFSAFFIHSYFLLTGHPEFGSLVSKSLLSATLVLSIVQGLSAVLIFLAQQKKPGHLLQ